MPRSTDSHTESYPPGFFEHDLHKHRIFLEIGPGRYPVVFDGGRTYGGPNLYLGVDPADSQEIVTGTDLTHQEAVLSAWEGFAREAEASLEEDIYFVVGYGQNMGFLPDSSIYEAYMADVARTGMPQEELQAIFEELLRVIQPGGRMVVRDIRDAAWVMSRAYEDAEALRSGGFGQVQIIHSDPGEEGYDINAFMALTELFGTPSQVREDPIPPESLGSFCIGIAP